jgi:glutamate 5-kinase
MRQRIVVKVGTSTLTNGTSRLHRQTMLNIVHQLAHLHQGGHEVVLVSSGAQACGREQLNFPEISKALPAKQMLSAVGQSRLMQLYADLFSIFELTVAQVLLTRDDLSHRTRYLNARDTLRTLLEHRLVPIINENDTIATEEIRVGDNDNLSALVASALEADTLIILTDQDGLYTANPRTHPNATLIPLVTHLDDSIFALAGGVGTKVGTGGMTTKLQAAQVATRSGVAVVIANGRVPAVLTRLIDDGERIGTRFEPSSTHLESRKRWILTERPQGTVQIDAGATQALRTRQGISLLPVGITRLNGAFKRGAVISVLAPDGKPIAHGLSNYDSGQLQLIMGRQSSQIADILGFTYGDEAVHRNNLVVLD